MKEEMANTESKEEEEEARPLFFLVS